MAAAGGVLDAEECSRCHPAGSASVRRGTQEVSLNLYNLRVTLTLGPSGTSGGHHLRSLKLHLHTVQLPRKKWVLQWPGQVVICASSIFWTTEVSEAIVNNTLPVSV